MNENLSTLPGSGPVVVAVDGTRDGVRALEFGVQQALRTGRRLRLVHVPHETMPMAPMLPLFSAETLYSVGRQVVAEAEGQARALGAEDVEAVVAHGPRVPAILEHADGASLIVVGPRSSRVRRLLTGSTSTGVAHRASCPVVTVPAEWSTGASAGGVVAGVDDSAQSACVVATALAAAHERGCRLTVLHAWRPIGQFDAAIVERSIVDTWRDKVTHELTRLTSALGSEYPDVPVKLRVEYHSTVPALVDASRSAQLLVIGRRGAGAPFALPLGSVARAMIGAAHCPVELVPVRRHSEHAEPSHGSSAEVGFAPTF